MLIVKYIFLFIIFTGASLVGNLISKKYKNRVDELKDLKEAYNIIESKIKFTYEPLGDIVKETSKILKKRNNIFKIFENTSKNMKNNDFRIAWETSINQTEKELNLNKEDLELIKTFGSLLGKTDVQGQLNEINLNMNFLDTQIKHAEIDQLKNEKMYRSLGTIIGLAIIIILI